MRTDDEILIKALEMLSSDIQSDDGVANACIAEAAQRLRELIAPVNAEVFKRGQVCEDRCCPPQPYNRKKYHGDDADTEAQKAAGE